MSFSKAQIKRFNESGGCAPPPGAYNPKFDDSLKGCVFDKSNRFPNQKVEDGDFYSSSSLSDFNFVTPRPMGKTSSSKKWPSSSSIGGGAKLGFKSSSNYELSKPSYDEIRHENHELHEKLNALREEKEKEIEHLTMMIGANEETCKLLYGQIMEGDKQKLADKETLESLLQTQKGSEEKITQLRAEISSKNNKIKKIQQKFEKLNKTTEEMEKRTCELNDKINKLEEINSALILETNKKIKKLGETNSSLLLQLDDLKKEMENEKGQFNAMLHANQATIQCIQDEKMTSEKKQLELKDFIQKLQQQLNKLDENNSNFQTQLSELSNEHECLVLNHNEVVKEKIILSQQFQQFVKDSSEEKDGLNAINSQLMMEISAKKELIEMVHGKIEEFKKYSEVLEIKISELNNKYDGIRHENTDLQEKLINLREVKENEISNLILAHEDQCKLLNGQIMEGEKQKCADKETLDHLLGNQKEAEELISQLRTEILSKNGKIEEILQKFEKLNRDSEEMEKRACELNDKYNEIQHENLKLQKALNDLREEKENEIESLILEGEKQKLADKEIIDDLLQKNENLEEIKSNQLSEISSKNGKIEELQQKIEELNKSGEEMENQMSELNYKINELEEANSNLILDTNNKIKELGDCNSNLCCKLDDLNEEMDKEKLKFSSMLTANQETIVYLEGQIFASENRQFELEDYIKQVQEEMGKLNENNSNLSIQLSESVSKYEGLALVHNEILKEKAELYEKLTDLIEVSDTEMTRLNSVIISHKEQIALLETRIVESDEIKDETDQLVSQLNIKIQELEDTNSNLILESSTKLDQMEVVNNDLNLKLNDLSEEMGKEKENLNTIINGNEEIIQSLKNQLATVEKSKSDYEDLVDHLNLQITRLERGNSHLENQLSELTSIHEIQLLTYDEVVREKMDLGQELEELRADSSEKYERFNLVITGHEEQIQSLELQVSEGDKKIEIDQDLINQLKSQIEETDTKLVHSESVNNDLNLKLNDLTEEMEKEKENLNSIINGNEEIIQSLENQMAQIEKSRCEYVEMVDDLNLQISQFDKENSHLTFEISELSSRYAILLLTHEEVEKEKVDLGQELEKLNADSNEKYEKFNLIINGHEEQIRSLEVQLAEGEKKCLEDQDLINQFKTQMNELEELNSNLLLDTSNRIKELGDCNSDLCCKLDDLNEEMDREKAEFNSQYQKDQESINHFKSQFEKSLKEIYELRAQTMSLRSLEMKVKSAQHLVKKEAEKHCRIIVKFNELNDKLFQQSEINTALSEERNFDKSNFENSLNLVKGEAQEEIRRLERKVADLESLIGPFKNQLMSYEEEMRLDRDLSSGKESNYKDMAEKYAQILGHQNSRQKIHHVIKLKEDLLQNRKDKEDLQKEVVRLKKALADSQRLTSNSRRFDPKKAFSTNPTGSVLQQNNDECN